MFGCGPHNRDPCVVTIVDEPADWFMPGYDVSTSGHLRLFCHETPIFIEMNNYHYRLEFLSYEHAIGLIRKDFA